MRMIKIELTRYFAPEIEVNEVSVEQGFALSDPSSETMPEIEGENEEIGW